LIIHHDLHHPPVQDPRPFNATRCQPLSGAVNL
jgi:hypothetical protein